MNPISPRFGSRRGRVRILSRFLLLAALLGSPVFAQEPNSVNLNLDELQNRYRELVEEFRTSMRNVSEAGIRFNLAPQQESAQYRELWYRQVAETESILNQLKPLALRLFMGQPDPPAELRDFVRNLSVDFYERGLYPEAAAIADRILAERPDDQAMIFLRGRCTFLLNEFEEALQFVEKYPNMVGSMPEIEQPPFADVEALKERIRFFEEEERLREQEAADDDLPRAEIKTTKGTFVVELFENQAPNTVGNFIYLIENGYYNGKLIHRVLNQFMAQGGGKDAQGQYIPPGYTIYDECGEPDARHHFRGVLSMAKGENPHTGSSQFFITFVPTFHLDGLHTVFGRVISGMDVVDRLNRTRKLDENDKETEIEDAVPDRILSVRVLRKRDHDYKPDRFDGTR